ncbi:MAG TPA: Ppx/GppA phosphatase family protein [Holophagaceae bacterium]|nr:Ppx/GppA phosphatase family protein [Holophagaceae bacterium]
MRIAALDVGSNSLHLVVVEVDSVGNQRVLAREKAMVRLARGNAQQGEIASEAFQEGLEALALMAQVIEGFHCDTVMACGTAALRDARNAPDFLRESARLGITIRIISGEEEARLIHLAVSHAIPFPEGPVTLMDIGGGSTELTWVEAGHVLASTSIPFGLQRLAEACPTDNPPTLADLKRLRRFTRKVIKKARKHLPPGLPAPGLVLGTSGTLEDLALGSSGTVRFDPLYLRRFKKKLWSTDTAGRLKLGVPPKRAEVLHVGAAWAAALLDWLGNPPVQHLPVGLREGMIWDALAHGGAAIPPLAERRRVSVEALAARHDPDPGHSRHVQDLADQLFRAVQPWFELGEREREWLQHASRLHDIGFSVAEKGHHKHGAYLLRAATLPGFWPEEIDILAQVVRHHRGKDPQPEKHEAFRNLPPWHRDTVRKLTGILRAADALDRRRRQSVTGLSLEDGDPALALRIRGEGDLGPELEALDSKGSLLVELLGRPVRVVLETAP